MMMFQGESFRRDGNMLFNSFHKYSDSVFSSLRKNSLPTSNGDLSSKDSIEMENREKTGLEQSHEHDVRPVMNGFAKTNGSFSGHSEQEEVEEVDAELSFLGASGKDTKQRVVMLNNNNNYSIPPECSRSCTTEKLYFHRFSSVEEELPYAAHEMDISTGHIVLSYMEDHMQNIDRLGAEWQALCAYEPEPPNSTADARRACNSRKNRSSDVLPYDHKRIVLNKDVNVSNGDYINASSLTDHDPRRPMYVVTQGPLPHTVADFWQLVWEQDTAVIVNLTSLVENDVSKCHQYWPQQGCDVYHIYEVHLVSEHVWCEDCTVRSLFVKNIRTSESRTVTQYHYMSWPDHGLPQSTKRLLDFRRKVNRSYRGQSRPIVVHCSDGVGRTGTYCLIDTVLTRLAKGAKELDISATLENFRDQNRHLVSTKEQFEFVLMTVAEEVEYTLKMNQQYN